MTHLEQTASPGTERGMPTPGLRRSLEQYAGCNPHAVASGSKAQMMYFVEDAKADIATLARELLSCRTVAPTMLEALKEVRKFHHTFAMNGSVHKAVIDAIALAEGRTPTETKGGAK